MEATARGTLCRWSHSTGPERATARNNPISSTSTADAMPATKRQTRNSPKRISASASAVRRAARFVSGSFMGT
jgi:hypothetical protein